MSSTGVSGKSSEDEETPRDMLKDAVDVAYDDKEGVVFDVGIEKKRWRSRTEKRLRKDFVDEDEDLRVEWLPLSSSAMQLG
jgi:hypothetical protein